MLNRIKIVHKVYILAAFLLALILLVGFIGLSQMKKIGAEIVDIAEIDIPLNNLMTQITEHQLAQVIELERSVLYGVLTDTNVGDYEKIMLKHIKKMKELSKKIEHEIKDAEKLAEEALLIAHSEAAKNKFTELGVTLKNIEKSFLQTEDESFQLADLLLAHKMKEAPKSPDRESI